MAAKKTPGGKRASGPIATEKTSEGTRRRVADTISPPESSQSVKALQEHATPAGWNADEDDEISQLSAADAAAVRELQTIHRSASTASTKALLQCMKEKNEWNTSFQNLSKDAEKYARDLVSRDAEIAELTEDRSVDKGFEKTVKTLLNKVQKRDRERDSAKVKQLKARNEQLERRNKTLENTISMLKECVICTEEFGPERHRGLWLDCNHGNVCFNCSKTMWESQKRRCPTCNTVASEMALRLPIFL